MIEEPLYVGLHRQAAIMLHWPRASLISTVLYEGHANMMLSDYRGQFVMMTVWNIETVDEVEAKELFVRPVSKICQI